MVSLEQMNKLQIIIKNIYCNKDINSMRTKVSLLLKEIIDFDLICIDMGTTQNSKPVITDTCVFSNLGSKQEHEFMSLYESKYEALDYLSWIYSSKESVSYRLSDIIKDEFRYNTTFYQNFMSTFNLDYAIGIVLVGNGNFCGDITLIRKKGKPDFSDDDLLVLNLLLPHFQTRFLEHMASKTSSGGSFILKNHFKLTKREIEMVRCIYNNMTNDEIAQTLDISPKTVKKHINNLFSKLEVKNRAGLMKFIMDNGFSDICKKL